jgi:hypothetical protein
MGMAGGWGLGYGWRGVRSSGVLVHCRVTTNDNVLCISKTRRKDFQCSYHKDMINV